MSFLSYSSTFLGTTDRHYTQYCCTAVLTGAAIPCFNLLLSTPTNGKAHLDLLDDLTEGRTVPDTVLAGDPDLLRALTLQPEVREGAAGRGVFSQGSTYFVERFHGLGLEPWE